MVKAISNGKQAAKALARRLILSPASAYLARRFIYGRRGFERRGTPEALFLLGLDFRGKEVFDVGSSIGDFTQFFAASVGRTGYVVAFEPNPSSYQQVKQRTGRDIDLNVLAVNMAVGLAAGTCHLMVRDLNPGTGSIDPVIQRQIVCEGDYYELDVPMCSLDSYVASSEGEVVPDFIKIDTEGAEFDVLRGATQVLQMYHPELLIEVHGATRALKEMNIENVVRFLEELDYSICHVESRQEVSLANCRIAAEGHIYCCS